MLLLALLPLPETAEDCVELANAEVEPPPTPPPLAILDALLPDTDCMIVWRLEVGSRGNELVVALVIVFCRLRGNVDREANTNRLLAATPLVADSSESVSSSSAATLDRARLR